MTVVRARTGRTVQLGAELGRGGEGAIVAIPEHPELVAKLYHRPPEPRKVEKLRAMVGAADSDLLAIGAWPVDLLLSGGVLRGFVMPAVRARRDVHELYSPKSRFEAFPAADFRFLLHVGANVARAFATVHARGHVIGDVNHGGVLVGPDGTVRLIDCDSFQITAGGRVYTCDVGVPLFTPPELHGRSFRGLIRHRAHDGFGLAVLLFHLLFMGRHPFAGRFRGNGEMPIERAIAERRFAYGPGPLAGDMERPPGTLSLSAMAPEVGRLFMQAFTEANRPPATAWVSALDRMRAGLRPCRADRSHHFPKHLADCPWCGLEKATGIPLFGQRIVVPAAVGAINLKQLWQAIERVADPGPDPVLPADRDPLPGRFFLPPVKVARQLGSIALVVVGLGLCVALPSDSSILGVLVLWALAGWLWPRPDQAAIRAAERQVHTARAAYERGVARFHAEASHKTFMRELSALRVAHTELIELPKLRARRMAELRAEREQHQLAQYLDRFRIDRAKISGIGPGRTAMLASYGIESAADLEYGRIVRIPGFGEVLADNLLRWRDGHRRRFRFNSNLPVDPRAIAALDREIDERRRKLTERLRNGSASLERIRQRVVVQRPRQLVLLEKAWQTVVEAEAVRRAL